MSKIVAQEAKNRNLQNLCDIPEKNLLDWDQFPARNLPTGASDDRGIMYLTGQEFTG